jgi:hypothetical protein
MVAKLTSMTHKIAIQLHLVVAFAVLIPGGQSGNFWLHPHIYIYIYIWHTHIHTHVCVCVCVFSRDSSVVQRWATDWMIGGSSPGRDWEFFSLPPRSDRLWGPSQPPIRWVPGAPSLGVKRSWCEADHSPPSSAEVKAARSYTSIPNAPSWRGAQLKHRDNFTFMYTHTHHSEILMGEAIWEVERRRWFGSW